MVKCVQPPQLRYICFDHLEFRIYKGEGTVQLLAYYPFAFGVVSPKLAWSENGAIVNNPGDLPANLEIIYPLADSSTTPNISLSLIERASNKKIGSLILKDITARGENDKYIMINTQTQLIEGLDANKQKTGYLYNRFINSGDFFYPPLGQSVLTSTPSFLSAQYTPLYY